MKKIGFDNNGNTCYINSLVQCLLHLDILNELFQKEPIKIHNKLTQYMYDLFKIKHNEIGDKNGITCNISSIVKEIYKSSNGLFEPLQQHDICELYVWFIDQLHEGLKFTFEVKKSISGPMKQVWDTLHRLQNGHHSRILDIFQGVQVNLLKCNNTSCEDQPYNLEPSSAIYLDIPNTTESITDICSVLMNHFKSEQMTEWKCDKCSQYGGTRKIRIWNLPPVLVIIMKRFGNDMKKNHSFVKIPEYLQFAKGTVWNTPAETHNYRLKSIGNHYGSFNGGHYTAVVRETTVVREKETNSGETKWVHWDDNQYEEINDINTFLQKNNTAYVLFYERT